MAEVERLAAGMEVEHDVGARQQFALEIVGDLLRHRAVGPAGKADRFMLPLSIGDVRVPARKAG